MKPLSERAKEYAVSQWSDEADALMTDRIKDRIDDTISDYTQGSTDTARLVLEEARKERDPLSNTVSLNDLERIVNRIVGGGE